MDETDWTKDSGFSFSADPISTFSSRVLRPSKFGKTSEHCEIARKDEPPLNIRLLRGRGVPIWHGPGGTWLSGVTRLAQDRNFSPIGEILLFYFIVVIYIFSLCLLF